MGLRAAAGIAFLAFLATGCGGDDVPGADKLPLAPGLDVTASDVRPSIVDNSPYRQLVLAVSSPMNDRAINRAEVRYLRQRGWKTHRHDSGTAATAPDRGVWAFIGFAEGDCRGLADSTSGGGFICASLGD
jgi:hypothetical protein